MTEIIAGATVDAARRTLAARFAAAALDSPELDARLLIGHVLQLDLTGLVVHGQRPLSAADAVQLETLVQRRLAGEPVARIRGIKEFWGLELALSADTLVPRPDTETVVELALEYLASGGDLTRRLRIADLGTGSGAILLALLSELPHAIGIGTDISIGALQTARQNARSHGLGDRAGFVACSYASALSAPFDLIVSNPPYIPRDDIGDLAIDVRAHDPLRALDGGADGLDAYRALIPQAAGLLAIDGALIVEVGQGQSADVAGLMKQAGLAADSATIKADLGGIPRAVMALKKVR
ncbi:release factor glutamine methyltransferase [Bradyrhizobium sp. SSBR45G]|uniref:peptide chain release factor N(5)-glutamine methyltransferase n=1 Tax=unclassified Bradyrhizobium TaxID=2631580 RepID=UPI00234291E1|nr:MULTISPECIES: peptide chain release factor N(5)-glutamine methyltransferase [unclassified Bradyrhizobium]GLH78008.1 release factor glutamine methyltransferase [Bradyrhizobium sp. SSBR45G]GLH88653.1 release factor glutamine methyltransferase [Bradyrhizobium sp. SSBR45R]